MLYRAFPWTASASLAEPGGPLFVNRTVQTDGRHDNSALYGALYASRSPLSPAAELLKNLHLQQIGEADLLSEGRPYALVELDDSVLDPILDLDDPRNLVTRGLRPSRVATRDRGSTQTMAGSIFAEGLLGFEWWSTIEASWINVTLFAERCADSLRPAGRPEVLTMDHPVVREAADAVGVSLEL